MAVNLEGLELDVDVGAAEPLDLHLERATAAFDLATDAGYVEDTVATGAGGEVHLSASFSLRPTAFDLQIEIPKPLQLEPYLPPRVTQLIGGNLSGNIHAAGNNQLQRLDQLDLRLGRARVSGKAFRSSEGLIHAENLNVQVADTHLRRIRGHVDTAGGEMDLDFSVESGDLAYWLRNMRAPAVAQGLTGSVHMGGTLANPKAQANLVATGVPVANRVEADLSYADHILSVREAQSSAFGGWLRASGKVQIGRAMRLLDVEAQGVNLKLADLPVVGAFVDGEVDVVAHVDGPVSRPNGKIVADISRWSVAGDRFKDTRITAITEEDGSHRLGLTLERIFGGTLHVDAYRDRATTWAAH